MHVTIDDIARRADVSKASVSRVLNGQSGVGEATRRKIQAIIDELDYKPNMLARGIACAKTKTIGVIIPDITNPFFPQLIRVIDDDLSQEGYTVILCNTDSLLEREKRALATCIEKRVDGVVFASSAQDSAQVHATLEKYRLPCVFVDRGDINPDADAWVFTDNEYAVFSAVRYLIESGNRRIAYLSGPPGVSTSKERLKGYHAALEQYGIPVAPELIRHGDYTMEGGARRMEELLLLDRPPSAIFAANDMMAIGAIRVLKRAGIRIPEEVEVIGFDNIETSALIEPSLTTVEQPVVEMGHEAVRLLLAMLNHQELRDRAKRMRTRLVLRESTKNIVVEQEEWLWSRGRY